MSDLLDLPLSEIDAHPDNPRLQLREDVVERLVAEIGRSEFGREHAVLVRPLDGRYQLVSGHHRAEAARRLGLPAVPAWSRTMDDDEAFMQLVLSNTQGELSSLEIGMHALRAVPLASGGRGQRGGLSEYADRLGWSDDSIRQWRAAADVATETTDTCREFRDGISDRTRHLFEISKAPRETWSVLVVALVKSGWTVKEVASQVEKVRTFSISGLDTLWLPLNRVIERYLASGKPSPAAVRELSAAAYTIFKAIDDRDGEDAFDDEAAFRDWLVEHSGKESWDRREIGNYHVGLIRKWAEQDAAKATAAAEDIPPSLPEGIELRLGDFRDVLKDLPDASLDAIVTDPPYPAEFVPLFADLAELAARTLKPGGLCAVMVGQSYLPEIYRLMSRDDLAYHWTIAYLTPGGQATQLWQRKVMTFHKPVLVYVKGEYSGPWIGDVTKSDVNDNDKRHHHWGQSESGMADLIERLTQPNDLICDPFLGGGTTALVAHGLGRRFIGCDTDESCIATTTERFVAGEA